MEPTGNTTLYVGNLDHSVTEELICTLFSKMGPVKSCKVIRDSGSDPYAFVEYHHHTAASTALSAMNKRSFLDREMKVIHLFIYFVSYIQLWILFSGELGNFIGWESAQNGYEPPPSHFRRRSQS